MNFNEIKYGRFNNEKEELTKNAIRRYLNTEYKTLNMSSFVDFLYCYAYILQLITLLALILCFNNNLKRNSMSRKKTPYLLLLLFFYYSNNEGV
jgi:hypothetical protein